MFVPKALGQMSAQQKPAPRKRFLEHAVKPGIARNEVGLGPQFIRLFSRFDLGQEPCIDRGFAPRNTLNKMHTATLELGRLG